MSGGAPVLIAGEWTASAGSDGFDAVDPASGELLGRFPTSPWHEVDAALQAGADAARSLAEVPVATIAAFLGAYADRIDAAADELARLAARETGLPAAPRLRDVEIPRTSDQLRQAAAAAIDHAWVEPVLSPASRIAARLAPIPGVVCVFGPNNFPFAFNGASGGDFAAAVATRHPVLVKANPGHPGTTRMLTEAAMAAAGDAGLHPATIQLLYRTSHQDGERMVADPRVAATAYTGSRAGGLALKASADAAGRPIYLEMSSVNPVVVLPGALAQRGDDIAADLAASVLLGSGQFCTSPGLILVAATAHTEAFVRAVGEAMAATPAATLLGQGVAEGLAAADERWRNAGATVVATGPPGPGSTCYPNTLMRVDAERFLERGADLQTEAFGNMSLVVVAEDLDELLGCVTSLEGNLTGTIYAADDGADAAAYEAVEPALRQRVGRLLNDKVPTGVAVVAAMNHGGPFPSTGHPGFTAVGLPASMRRFAMLQCYDNVPDGRLPDELKADNPLGLVRRVDGRLTADPVVWGQAS